LKNQVQLVLKDNIRDVEAEKIRKSAESFLLIDTGQIKTAKIYNVTYQLTDQQLKEFAEKGLQDEIIHDVFIEEHYKNKLYNSFILVAKMPGVTDDEGISAQKTLIDILDLKIDTSTQHIYSEDLYLIENELSYDQLRTLAENILGNKLIHHFEYGKFTGKIEYLPEVKIRSEEPVKTVNLNLTDEALLELSKNMLLSLNLEEMKAVRNYFEREDVQNNRKNNNISIEPTDCELEVLAQTWSEHCKHKEFSAEIDYTNHETGEKFIVDSLFKTYIRRSTEIIQNRLKEAGTKGKNN